MEQAIMNDIDRELLDDLPIGLLLLDRDNRIGWANRGLAELLGMPETDLTGQKLGQLPKETQRILETDPQLFHDEAGQRWIRRMVQRGAAGERLVILTDETEQERLAEENARLRQQVEDLRLTDELTGLPNRRAITQSLELHVSRSRRYQNPLSAVLVHLDVHRFAGVQPMSIDPVILGVSRFLRDRLRWVDQIARWEDTIFLLVLPETNEEDARSLLNKIAAEAHNVPLPDPYGDVHPGLSFGLACWQKGDDVRTLLRRAVQDLRDHNGA